MEGETEDQKSKRLWRYRAVIFLITYWAYAMMHATRLCFATSKPDILDDPKSHVTLIQFGTIDLFFLFSYALSGYVAGPLGDRSNLRYFLYIACFAVSIIYSLFTVCRMFNIVNVFTFCLIQIVAGFFNSWVYPGSVGVLGKWFTAKQRPLMIVKL